MLIKHMPGTPYDKRFKLVVKWPVQAKWPGQIRSEHAFLENLQNRIRNPDHSWTNEPGNDMMMAFDELDKIKDLKTRLEGRTLGLYSNDDYLVQVGEYLDQITHKTGTLQNPNKLKSMQVTAYEARTDTSSLHLTVKGVSHQVILKHMISIPFSNWLLDHEPVLKYGKVFKEHLTTNRFGDQVRMGGKYFYVPDEKLLMLIKLSFYNDIRRIRRVVTGDTPEKCVTGTLTSS